MNCVSYYVPDILLSQSVIHSTSSAVHRQKDSVMQDSAWTEGQACSVSLGDMMALQDHLFSENPPFTFSLISPTLREMLFFHDTSSPALQSLAFSTISLDPTPHLLPNHTLQLTLSSCPIHADDQAGTPSVRAGGPAVPDHPCHG